MKKYETREERVQPTSTEDTCKAFSSVQTKVI